MRRLLLGLACLLPACGGSDPSGPSPDPVITFLSVVPTSPEVAPGTVTYDFKATVTDPNGDIFLGQCEVATNLGTVTGPINILGPGTDPAATQGIVTCPRSFSVSIPQDIRGTVVIIDIAGHRSNAVAFILGIRLGVSGAAPLLERPAGSAAMLGRR